MTNTSTFAPQCAYAVAEVALSFLDAGDMASAYLVVHEGLAFCGANSPTVLRDLDAVLNLCARFGPNRDLGLLGYRVSLTVTPNPESLPDLPGEDSLVH